MIQRLFVGIIYWSPKAHQLMHFEIVVIVMVSARATQHLVGGGHQDHFHSRSQFEMDVGKLFLLGNAGVLCSLQAKASCSRVKSLKLIYN